MACTTLEEILKSCDGNLGGITRAYFNNTDSIDWSSLTVDAITKTIDVLDLESAAPSFVEFQFNPNTSNFTENTLVNLQNGSTYYEPIITLVLARREAAKRAKLLLIANGQPSLAIIVKDANGLYWLFGEEDNGIYLTGNEGGSGTAKADLNGYTLTFSAGEGSGTQVSAYQIDEAVVAALI